METVAVSCMVRVGIVVATDYTRRLAQVRFQDLNLISDWLPVLTHCDAIPDYDVPQRTEYCSGGSDYAAFAEHSHTLTIRPWMPKTGEQVLCLYEPIRDGQGFVLGGVQTWR